MAKAAKKWTDEQLEQVQEILGNFELFCESYLQILDFKGNLVPFTLNRPQRRFIKTIMQQWQETGKIRVVIAKARKMGFSTVITAFMFWRLYTNISLHALAGTHHEETNKVLVGIFNRFVRNLPEGMKPTIGIDNASGMTFSETECSYHVKAASNTEKVGRGDTVQMLHVSEIAHIDRAEDLPGSLFSTVADVDDSMIFLESTANGMGNYHHNLFLKAERKELGCEYIAFFAPWYEDDRYQKDVPEGFVLTEYEKKLKGMYDLTDRQISWYRSMLSTMGTTNKQALAKMKQEYPSNSNEAFQYSAVDSFIEADLVIQAMNRPLYRSYGAIIAGYDPSFKGKDRDAFIYRQGANMWGLETPVFGEDEDARVRYLKEKLDNKACPIDMLFIDAGAGYGIHSRLVNDGYGKRVRRIEFGSGADNPLKYQFKRDEMFGDFVELLNDKHVPLAIDISDDLRDAFLQDLTATGYKHDSKGRPKMESKESLRARGIRSTDLTDAAILTVAHKVVRHHVAGNHGNKFVNDNTNIFGSLRKRRRR